MSVCLCDRNTNTDLGLTIEIALNEEVLSLEAQCRKIVELGCRNIRKTKIVKA